jgi:ribose 1,5-bisphosphokinase
MQHYPSAVVVEVAAEPEVIAKRLAGRGRETAESIEERMSRSVPTKLPTSTVSIDNSGDLTVAGEQFLMLLKDLVRQPAPFARQEIG